MKKRPTVNTKLQIDSAIRMSFPRTPDAHSKAWYVKEAQINVTCVGSVAMALPKKQMHE